MRRMLRTAGCALPFLLLTSPVLQAANIGMYSTPTCASISDPVVNQTWCLDRTTGDLKVWSGTVWRDAAAHARGEVSVTDYGASPSATAAVNTAAFNAAIATGKPVFVPAGDWHLNALADVTSGLHLYGVGRATKLIFNTAGVAINLNDVTPDQGQTYSIHDLAFGNETNVPAAIIRNSSSINDRFERLYFSTIACTYCIDNESGYGTKISDCVFSDVTGSGVRFRQNAAVSDYSYAASVQDSDFTRVSVTGIEVEGSQSLNIIGGVIESSVTGLKLIPATNSVQAWNVNVIGTHFELNTAAIAVTDSSGSFATVNLHGATSSGTPIINLGDYSRLVVFGGQQGGGNEWTVNGGAEARVFILAAVTHNYVKGTFTGQWFDLGQYYDAASTPAWFSFGTPNDVGTNGTLTSRWTRNGSLVTLSIALTIGASPTINAGVFQFTDALLTALPALEFKEAAGSAFLYDSNTGNILPATVYLSDATTVQLAGISGNGAITDAVPWTWAEGDQIRITITYRGTAS